MRHLLALWLIVSAATIAYEAPRGSPNDCRLRCRTAEHECLETCDRYAPASSERLECLDACDAVYLACAKDCRGVR